ncbi:uncharacterized protein LOC122850527 [Aphidius gifuensis]|uniref:uncharacterized protein LOC122850527 n=1 Tax=Aphidius gifuensis TaxID=684658 RepID=UPI001CDCCC6B|nr:uncharacterized protein LOC122850527 [Aphidius gifuensis]
MGRKLSAKPLDDDVIESMEMDYSDYEAYDSDDSSDDDEDSYNFKYVLNLCGFNLISLNLFCYPNSQIMPILNANCPKLWDLAIGFKEIISQDLENCFSNMPKLKLLSIKWQCENSTIPMTLIQSLKQIGGTLEVLKLSCSLQENDLFSPDSLAPVFPRLIALKRLNILQFGLSQLLIQSISEMKNLHFLQLMTSWSKNHPVLDTRINMYPIGNMKNLKSLVIDCDYGIRDEFLINLCNNAKKLTELDIVGINITDTGISAINNLKQLHHFQVRSILRFFGPQSLKNEFITDESIQCLSNRKLDSLDISNCVNVTDKSVLKLVENLPNLTDLSIRNTKV